MKQELNKTILGQPVEILEKVKYEGEPWHWYKITNGEKVRIAPAKYLEDPFWR